MAEAVTPQNNGKWQYKCSCGAKASNYADKELASIAYRLHRLGHIDGNTTTR